MNIKGKANDHKRIRKLLANLMVLLVAAAFCFAVPGFDTFAAGGSVTVSVPEINDTDFDSEGFEGFTFKVYKVGHYDGADFALDKDYADLGVKLPSGGKSGDDTADGTGDNTGDTSGSNTDGTQGDGTGSASGEDSGSSEDAEAWMKAASDLAKQMKTLDTAPSPVPINGTEGGDTSVKVKPGEKFTFTSTENALYLLVADPVVSGNATWTPVPAFIRTLNGSEEFSYTVEKIDKELFADEYTVTKVWADDNNAAGSRPTEVKVAILYGDTRIDVVTLNNDGWTYAWKIKKTGNTYIYEPQTTGKGEAKNGIDIVENAVWSAVELTQSDAEAGIEVSPNMQSYTVSYTTQVENDADGKNAKSYTTITNSLIPQDEPKSIRITKNIDGYDADMQNVTFSFRIDGYSSGADGSASGTPIWTNHAGITFSPTDALSKEVIINNVPAAVEAITVTEEYSGNYKLDGTPVITREGNVWTVVMNNKHDDNGHGGGVVNKYEDGKAPVQQGL